MTFITARERGFKIDAGNLQTQLQFTADFLAKGRANYLQGKGQGGHAFTAGSALWTLKLGNSKPDANTEAVIEYLLGHQKELHHWKPPSIRPPSEESPFSATFFALESIRHFKHPHNKIARMPASTRHATGCSKRPRRTPRTAFSSCGRFIPSTPTQSPPRKTSSARNARTAAGRSSKA
jgi:hypothetical protein